jgi:hypothetical protein
MASNYYAASAVQDKQIILDDRGATARCDDARICTIDKGVIPNRRTADFDPESMPSNSGIGDGDTA